MTENTVLCHSRRGFSVWYTIAIKKAEKAVSATLGTPPVQTQKVTDSLKRVQEEVDKRYEILNAADLRLLNTAPTPAAAAARQLQIDDTNCRYTHIKSSIRAAMKTANPDEVYPEGDPPVFDRLDHVRMVNYWQNRLDIHTKASADKQLAATAKLVGHVGRERIVGVTSTSGQLIMVRWKGPSCPNAVALSKVQQAAVDEFARTFYGGSHNNAYDVNNDNNGNNS
jgi:hypothetical protein